MVAFPFGCPHLSANYFKASFNSLCFPGRQRLPCYFSPKLNENQKHSDKEVMLGFENLSLYCYTCQYFAYDSVSLSFPVCRSICIPSVSQCHLGWAVLTPECSPKYSDLESGCLLPPVFFSSLVFFHQDNLLIYSSQKADITRSETPRQIRPDARVIPQKEKKKKNFILTGFYLWGIQHFFLNCQ